ncbi:UNVERIFIED_CONTAM: L-ascorbate oxidase [Sesamum radiatum]|uniref:L-ascorbate oxidase n=1 Tax=Sesamum radiatum TaxID=300843 RepID=A0AAW2RBX8_SESRA
MGRAVLLSLLAILAFWSVSVARAEDAYKYYTWTVTYGTKWVLGPEDQQIILINGQFPGPTLEAVTNDNIILNIVNKLDEPFLLTCSISQSPPEISPYSLVIGIMVVTSSDHAHMTTVRVMLLQRVQQILDSGKPLPFPDGFLIHSHDGPTFTGDQGKTYMLRISNIGLSTSFNFRIQGHKLKLVEVEGSHVLQNMYDSLDVHVGQSVTVLVTLDQPVRDYYIVASTRFTDLVYGATAVVHYSNSQIPVSAPAPDGPTTEVEWSIDQARSFRWNLTSNAARPNPQGSFHYGKITPSRTIVLANSAPIINGKQRYAVNGVSYINSDTPLKLADYFNIPGVFSINSIQSAPSGSGASLSTSVMGASLHEFIEVVFQNNEDTLQSWHLDGYDFWVVGFGSGQWTEASRKTYNLVDALTRHTTQVYPKSWTAILVSLDNQGMWNLRSAIWGRQYLGQQFYLRVYNPTPSLANEYDIPSNALLCGKAVGHTHP